MQTNQEKASIQTEWNQNPVIRTASQTRINLKDQKGERMCKKLRYAHSDFSNKKERKKTKLTPLLETFKVTWGFRFKKGPQPSRRREKKKKKKTEAPPSEGKCSSVQRAITVIHDSRGNKQKYTITWASPLFNAQLFNLTRE